MTDLFTELKGIAKRNSQEDIKLTRTKNRIKFFNEILEMPHPEALKQQLIDEWMRIIELTAKEEWGNDTMVSYDAEFKIFTIETWNRKMEL